MNASNHRGYQRLDRLFGLFQMISVALVEWVLLCLLMNQNPWLLFLLALPLSAAAFAIYRLLAGFLPVGRTVCLILSLFVDCLAVIPFRAILYRLLEGGLIPSVYYEIEIQNYLLFASLIFVLILAAATIASRIPTERFFSVDGAPYVLSVLYLIVWLLSLFSERSLELPLILAAAVTTVLFFGVLNQSGINEVSRKSSVKGVTSDMRMRNLKLTGLLLLLLFAIFFGFVVLMTGLYFTGKGILFLFLRSVLSDGSEASQDVEYSMSHFFEGGIFDTEMVNSVIFVIFVIAAVLLFVLACAKMILHGQFRISEVIDRIGEFFKKLAKQLSELFGRHRIRHAERVAPPMLPYKERSYLLPTSAYPAQPHNLESFRKRMKSIDDPAERFCYAYGTLVHQLRQRSPKMPMALTPSMSPREIGRKLDGEGRSDFVEIARIYEEIRYADHSVSDVGLERLTRCICGYVEANFRS